MTAAIDRIPAQWHPLLEEILRERAPGLLDVLASHDVVSRDDAKKISRELMSEFSRNLREDWEPTERGKDIDELTGIFIDIFIVE